MWLKELYNQIVTGTRHLTAWPMTKKTLTKRELVSQIAQDIHGIDANTTLNQQMVLLVVQKTLDYIAKALAEGNKVELRNFGVFEVKVRKARIGRNPNAPETDVPIPERSVVKFKPGKEMRAEVIKIQPGPLPSASAPVPPQSVKSVQPSA